MSRYKVVENIYCEPKTTLIRSDSIEECIKEMNDHYYETEGETNLFLYDNGKELDYYFDGGKVKLVD